MPMKPKDGESRDDFLARCIPEMVGAGKEKGQATAACSSMFSGKRSIAEIKSLEPVSMDEIRTRHSKYLAAAKHPSDASHTLVMDDDDHELRVSKRSADGVIALARAALPPASTLAELAVERGFEWDDSKVSRVIPYFASDERVDRHKDIVEQSWDFDDFVNNPVMLFQHNETMPPIGGVLKWDVVHRSDRRYSGPALWLASMFADAGTYPFADTVYRLVKAGFMRTGSVGFVPKAVYQVADRKEREILGLTDTSLIYRNNSLMEWSPCTMPANPGAHNSLMRAMSKNLLRPNDVQVIREAARLQALMSGDVDEKAWKRGDDMILRMWHDIYPNVSVPDARDVTKPIRMQFDEGEGEGDEGGEPTDDRPQNREDLLQMLMDIRDKVFSQEQILEDIRNMLEGGDDRGDEEIEEEQTVKTATNPIGIVSAAARLYKKQ